MDPRDELIDLVRRVIAAQHEPTSEVYDGPRLASIINPLLRAVRDLEDWLREHDAREEVRQPDLVSAIGDPTKQIGWTDGQPKAVADKMRALAESPEQREAGEP